jgi:hypothetical protein
MNDLLNRRFSIAHFDCWPNEDLYYNAIKNSSQQFQNELYDIYFGKIFKYNYEEKEIYDEKYRDHKIIYGNVMGVEASDRQVDNLFNIQKEFGIEISLTLNQLNIPVEIFYSHNNRVAGAFLDWLQSYYNRGLRSCTLANNHMMRAGLLQQRFPDMKWKNTVNQQVSSAQQVIDYLHLGFNIIQLDRSLNRNMEELKRIKEAVENYKTKNPGKVVKTCMLVMEDCMPSCPYKRAHDDLQIYYSKINYWDNLGALACGKWKNHFGSAIIPRVGTNLFWIHTSVFKEYAELVDIFKFSGRLNSQEPGSESPNRQFGWFNGNRAIDSFNTILGNELEPVCSWIIGCDNFGRFKTDIKVIKDSLKGRFLLNDKFNILEKQLKNCRSQCYNCHLCEKTYGLQQFDSLIQL